MYKLTHLFWLTGLVAFTLTPAGAATLFNGDFQTGDLSGWTVFTTANGTNGSGEPKVVSFDTTGGGASLAAEFNVGQITFISGDSEGGGLFQSIVLSAGILNTSANVAALGTFGVNGEGGIFELLIDTVVQDSFDVGTISASQTIRHTLSVSGLAVGAGTHEIRIEILRPFLTSNTITPFQYLDNINVFGSATTTGAFGLGLDERRSRGSKCSP